MNIFILDTNPAIAARMMIDAHVKGKMIIESAQMIQNCYSLDELKSAPLTATCTFRKHSYFNHPCSKWVRESFANYNWLLIHATYLINERIFRFNSKRHATENFIYWSHDNLPNLPDKGSTPFAQAMPDKYKNIDAVKAYRDYYENDKVYNKAGKHMYTWTRREIPYWVENSSAIRIEK